MTKGIVMLDTRVSFLLLTCEGSGTVVPLGSLGNHSKGVVWGFPLGGMRASCFGNVYTRWPTIIKHRGYRSGRKLKEVRTKGEPVMVFTAYKGIDDFIRGMDASDAIRYLDADFVSTEDMPPQSGVYLSSLVLILKNAARLRLQGYFDTWAI